MSSIILSPGEEFEHQHATPSGTTLVRGEVSISIGSGKFQHMVPNQLVPVPANTPHRLRNTGRDYAIIDCHHAR